VRRIKGLRDIKKISDIPKKQSKPSLTIPPLDVGIGRVGHSMGRPMVGTIPTTSKERWIKSPPKKPEKIKLPVAEKDTLVDVFDENDYILVTVDLSDIQLPEDFHSNIEIDEITEVSFRNGIFGIRLRKKKHEKLEERKAERKIIPMDKEITATVKKKIMLELKKQMRGG
jgi:hypothetical protein